MSSIVRPMSKAKKPVVHEATLRSFRDHNGGRGGSRGGGGWLGGWFFLGDDGGERKGKQREKAEGHRGNAITVRAS